VQKAHATGITSESHLKFKMYLPYLVMPIGGLLLLFRMVERLVMLGKSLKGQGAWKDPIAYGLVALSLVLLYMLTAKIDITVALLIMLVVMLLLGMPIAFGMGIASLSCLLFLT